jgi:hypothetical protein
MIILQPAEAALGGNPKRAVIIEAKVADTARAKPASGRIGCANLSVREIGYTAKKKSNP